MVVLSRKVTNIVLLARHQILTLLVEVTGEGGLVIFRMCSRSYVGAPTVGEGQQSHKCVAGDYV